jgi:hypothetical protein
MSFEVAEIKTSDSKQQFLTSLKNGKIGVFRPQLSLSELKKLLKDRVEIFETDVESLWLGEHIEVHFQNGLLTRVRFNFYGYKESGDWLKVVNLQWLDYLSKSSFENIREVLEEAGSKFKCIEYNGGELAILSLTPHAQFMIFFYEDGKLDQAHLEFDFRFRLFNDVKKLVGYPR